MQQERLTPQEIMDRGSIGSRAARTKSALLEFGRSHPTGAAGGIVLCLIILLVALAPVISPFRFDRTVARQLLPPMSEATLEDGMLWIGSDELGRDVVSRLLYGGRVSMFVGIMSPLIGVAFGTVLGIASAYFGKVFDLLVQRLVDTVLILPGIVVAMTITVAFGFTVPVVIAALAVSYSASSVRVVRSRALTLSGMQYVEAARAIGSSDTRIIFRHLVPNSLPVSMVLIAVSVGAAITAEAALSFLGIGIQPPIPSWGNMLTRAQLSFDLAPHIAIAPGMAITLVVLAINLFGDSLRDVLDPRLRNVR